MSYQQTTDQKRMIQKGDFKDNLLRTNQVLKSVKLNDNLCIVFKKDKWYYTISDVATWSKCKNIKTVLFYHIKNKPKGKTITLHGMEQFIFKYKNKHAVYSVVIYALNDYDPNIITGVGFQKVPNLKDCKI